MASSTEKSSTKEPSAEIGEIDDDDEETRMRDRLLARRRRQLQEMIAAEPTEETTGHSSGKKSHHHHHHKKKKRRHGSIESEESESTTKPDRLPSIASAVAVVQSSDNFAEEEGLNIKPPQALSSGGSSSYQKRHKKRSRDRSPVQRDEREGRHHQPRLDSYDSDRKRQRADEGWSNWKKSLDRPYSYGRGMSHSHSGSEMHGRSRSPSSKTSSRQGSYRPREGRVSPSPASSSSSRWLSSKISSATSDRPRSYASTDHQPTSRDDRRQREGRHHASGSSEKPSKQGRSDAERTGTKLPTTTIISASALVTVVSPEATPTMDEADDFDAKRSQTSPESSGQKNRPQASKVTPRSSDRSGSTAGKSNRSSMESGEHRSDEEEGESREHEKVEKEKKTKYSKFESSSSESDSESEADQDNYQRDHATDESDIDEGAGDNGKGGAETATAETETAIDPMDLDVSPAPEFAEPVLPIYYPALMGCRSVEEFHSLNRIEEGTYGVVYRAKEKRTDEIVALKRLKMEKEKEGFPITSLREINMLLKAGKHPNIVKVREIVVGSNMDKIYLVMDYVEHDLKSLLETMKQPFLIGEVKTLLKQILAGIRHLHENWILHRDLKTSNLLLSHKGILKIADFGLAREYGSPLKPYTPVVVTLWYRAPELLLGIKEYSTPIDIWSVGCIFAEILTLKPLFTGKSEIEQLNKIFTVLGTPNDTIWPGYSELPGVKRFQFANVKFNYLRKHFGATLSDKGFDLMKRLLTYDPEKRIKADEALEEEWFKEEPRPVRPDMFPTWPAKSEQSKAPRKGTASPKPPSGGKQFLQGESDKDYLASLKGRGGAAVGGFSLKFDAPKF